MWGICWWIHVRWFRDSSLAIYTQHKKLIQFNNKWSSRFKMMKIHGYFQDCLSPPLSFVFWMKITFHIPPQIFRIACFPAPFLLLLSFLAYFDFWFRRFPRLLTPKSRPHWNLWVRLQHQHNECCHPFGKINFDTIFFSKRYVCWQHWHISCCDPLMVKFC